MGDYELRLWHGYFGLPGSLNDRTIVESSPLIDLFLEGKIPRVKYTLANKSFDLPYILAPHG